MVKQPAKRPRATAKPKNIPTGKPSDDESHRAAAPVADTIPPEVYPRTVMPSEPETAAEPSSAAVKAPAPAPEPATVARSGSGFVPMLLGGVVAGAIGFAVASLTTPSAQTDLQDTLAAQNARIDALQQQVGGQANIDLAPLESGQADLATQITRLQDDLSATVEALEGRIATLENRPVADGAGGTSATVTAEFESEVAALRAELTELTDMARTELDTARAEAAAIEENAAAAARAAAGRAALARLQTAIESGAPLGAALGDLEQVLGEPAPDALLAAQDGVPTLAALQDSFPDYARAALTTARAEGVAGEDVSGVGAFLRNQFQVRSVNPRDGDDVDAILSRAQAALRGGLLNDTLAEIAQLPEVARAELSDWLALAEARADSIAAIDGLATSLSDN
ncbi:COG4223 family protein [Yoonia vestfoldensis]|uniref:COG4223 family protein n=1 Tax=Yoonia vestfoldensis TaxID=245188 RepID=UPI0003826444|nr:hypothetical protein [Yoonia vestfoldensis]